MQTRLAVVLGVISLAACRIIDPAPPPEAPRIGSFTASQTRTSPGEQVTLTFTTTGASEVELIDDSGRFIQLEGGVDSGTATVAPTRSAFYVLRATGAGGRDSAFVQIAVNEPLKDLFLIAVPASLDSGEEGQLLWGAPGASSVTLTTSEGMPQPLTGSTGSVVVSPAVTERYTLTAQGAPGTPPLTALTEIQVRPVLRDAAVAAPNGVQPGETLTFSWTTAGAARVTVSEQTFGPLTAITDPAGVASGTFDYTVPLTLPNGIALTDGLLLHFVVSATGGDVTVTRTLTAVVGDLPSIEQFAAPEAASAGRSFPVSWRTINATQVTISVGGLAVFQTLPGAQAAVDQGSVSLPVPPVQTEYTFAATNDRGARVTRVFQVRPVAPPAITSFTLTSAVTTLGDPATARWTTMNATRLQLRLENGATLAVVSSASQVASGSVVLTPATSARVVLEAYNAAGDLAAESRAVSFSGSPVSVTPSPVERGAQATVSWTLGSAGVLETVGLASPALAPITGSTRFVDLAAMTTATELVMPDTTNGAAQLTPPDGFRFPLLGTVQPALYVSVNGFLAFAPPAALSTNADFTATNSAPSMLAPFWDDLAMGPASKVLYLLQATANGERFLVVQWDRFQRSGDPASELTFQVHLYETGQVAFVYGALSGSLSSATIGVKDAAAEVAQQYAYNSGTTVPAPALELNWFTGGPADGSQAFVAAGNPRIEFFGRTATGLVPVSGEVRTFGAGDVTVTEVMPLPESSVASTGQWLELRNNADASVDFAGLRVSALGSSPDGGFVIGGGAVVPPYGYLVIGQSTNLADTGGAPVSQMVSDLPLSVPDSVRVSLGNTVISTLPWDAGVTGSSLQLMEDVMVAAGRSPICTRTLTTSFGPAGAIGTPGAKNESCAPYSITSIAGGFLPAPAGSEILTSITSDDGHGVATLPVPFTYFGTAFTTFSLSTNGFITFGGTLTTSNFTNNAVVATTEPNGTVAVFWDDLVRDTGKNAMWRLADRTVISWENFRLISTLATNTRINVQLHLLDTGALEFHYGTLATTLPAQATIDRVGGNSATVWLERPDGVVAVPWRINQLNGVVPNSGVRFTPVP